MRVLTDINGIIIETASGVLRPKHDGWYEHYLISTDSVPMELLGKPITDYQGAAIQNRNPDCTFALDVLDQPKKQHKARINADCKRTIEGGFTSDALGAQHYYRLDLEDQANLAGSIEAARTTGASVPFKCTDEQGAKAYRLHTPAQIIQVGLDAYSHKLTTLQAADILNQSIDTATSEADLNAITWHNPD